MRKTCSRKRRKDTMSEGERNKNKAGDRKIGVEGRIKREERKAELHSACSLLSRYLARLIRT
jgi:hypothetical protein